MRDAQPDDSLFFHCALFVTPSRRCKKDSIFLIDSGHGGQVKDTDGDEVDGYDESAYSSAHSMRIES